MTNVGIEPEFLGGVIEAMLYVTKFAARTITKVQLIFGEGGSRRRLAGMHWNLYGNVHELIGGSRNQPRAPGRGRSRAFQSNAHVARLPALRSVEECGGAPASVYSGTLLPEGNPVGAR